MELNQEKIQMNKNFVLIRVLGGVAEVVRAPVDTNVYIVDEDELKLCFDNERIEVYCPICDEKQIMILDERNNSLTCPKCNVNLFNLHSICEKLESS